MITTDDTAPDAPGLSGQTTPAEPPDPPGSDDPPRRPIHVYPRPDCCAVCSAPASPYWYAHCGSSSCAAKLLANRTGPGK